MLEMQWIKSNKPQSLKTATDFNDALQKAQKQVIELTLGQIFKIDGITIEIIGIKNPEIANEINNSSVVMRIWDTKKSVLFTGDLGEQGGKKLLRSKYSNRLKSDYIQMAHHGQNGVDENFYKAVNPKYCIWPTPLWLWDNNDGNGKGSGTWKTLEVRGWMEKLNVKKHYRLFDGLILIN
jgi:beta-lactamase superfamily II metal-dependent hydrolase